MKAEDFELIQKLSKEQYAKLVYFLYRQYLFDELWDEEEYPFSKWLESHNSLAKHVQLPKTQ